MQHESRVHKSILNARVNLLYYFVFIVLSFFSRKIFLECLGPDFLGLTGTLSNILGILSLAEMGVGAAVSYHLYKPLEQGDKEKIEELVSVFGYLYRRIGLFILGAAVLVSLFIPLIFKNTIFNVGLILFAFYAILSSSLFSYFINYRQIILTADQRGYVVTQYLKGATFIKLLLQMAIAYYWGNYWVWLLLDIVYGVISCVVLNSKIHKVYPWLNATVKKGRAAYPQNKHIMAFTKQVFVHKMKDFLLNQSDQILIFAFVSLKMVAYYGNYTIVVWKVSEAFDSALGSFTASVGNLVAEGDRKRSVSVFWELESIRFFVAGFLIFSVYNLIEPFITLWLGAEYVLDHTILILLLMNILIVITRSPVDMFNNAYGHYADTWAAWAEGILNISVTLATAPFLGIVGILLGKIVSLFIIVILWKPFYLYRDGFKLPFSSFWKYMLRYYVILLLSIAVGTWLSQMVPIDAVVSFRAWILKSIIIIIPYSLLYLTIMYICTPGTRMLMLRLKKQILHK